MTFQCIDIFLHPYVLSCLEGFSWATKHNLLIQCVISIDSWKALMLRCQSKAFLKVRAFGNWHMFQTQPKNHQFFFRFPESSRSGKLVIPYFLCLLFQPLPSGGAVSFGPLFQRCLLKPFSQFQLQLYIKTSTDQHSLLSVVCSSALQNVLNIVNIFLVRKFNTDLSKAGPGKSRPVQASPDCCVVRVWIAPELWKWSLQQRNKKIFKKI